MCDKNKKILTVILFICILVWIAFIFYNSSQVSNLSDERSLQVLINVNKELESIGIDYKMPHKLLRKCAHVFEYATLGIFLTFLLICHTKRFYHVITRVVFAGFAVATCDEFLQTFVPGRTGNIIDVLIDSSGIIIGSLLLIAVFCLFRIIFGKILR